ncbi:MAG: aspartate/glutamate racemase family protein, partial [Candidatus Bathyarchaeia archaeon]
IALYKKHLNEYHLWDRCASLRDIGEVPDLAQLLTGKEETTFKKLEETCGKCIDEDGADVIILGSTTMHQSAKYLQERLPVPVLNPGLVAYKVAEMLVELGLSHSKHAYPTPTTLKDEMVLAMAAAVSTRKGKDIAVKA